MMADDDILQKADDGLQNGMNMIADDGLQNGMNIIVDGVGKSAAQLVKNCCYAVSEQRDWSVLPTSQTPADDECIDLDVRLVTAEHPTHGLSVGAIARCVVEPHGGDRAVDAAISGRYAVLFQRVQIALAKSSLELQRRLVSGDEARLGSVARAYQSTVGVDPSIEAPEPPEGFTAQLFAIRTSNLLRQMVLFAKETPHFAGLPRSTQIRLLRAGAMQCILLRSAELLDLGSESWVNHSGDKLSLEVLNNMSPDAMRDNFFFEHLSLSASVKHLVPADRDGKSDSIVFALLLIISLLSPDQLGSMADCGDGGGPAAVSDAQQHYVLLLRRHLEATYSFQHCARVLPALMQQINVLKRHSKKQNSGFMSCLAVRNDPLCQEVLEP